MLLFYVDLLFKQIPHSFSCNPVKCYNHGGNEFNLRARLEDLIEIEVKRAGKGFTSQSAPMTFSDASRLLNASILVMRILGWAWRWSEWWVEHDSNWEPLLEPGQNEKNMTKEQLKIVESTRESRKDDARRCRLAAFGAALRNRAYDVEDDGLNAGFDHESLERALRAVLNTKSLVGPLNKIEIKFYMEWLGRAYKSRSRLLGFGDDKIEVGPGKWCRHQKDETPKFELGDRSIPGEKVLGGNHIFEKLREPETDDFEVYRDHVSKAITEQKARVATQQPRKRAPKKKKGKRGRPARKIEPAEEDEDPDPDPAVPTADDHLSDSGRKVLEPVVQDANGDEMPQVVAKKKAGRPKKKRPLPVPDPADDQDFERQAEVQPKKRQRMQRLGVPVPPPRDNPPSPIEPGGIGSPSVVYDRVKKRARSKPQLFGAAEDKKKAGRGKLSRRRSSGQDESNEEVPFDSTLDVPILTLLARERDVSLRSVEGQKPTKDSDGVPKVSNDENVAVADKVNDKPPAPSKKQESVASKHQEHVVNTEQDAASKRGKEEGESSDVATKAETSAAAETNDSRLAEEEENSTGLSECAEDRMATLEKFTASATTARERGRLTGKWLAIEDFFKTPRSFRGHCDFPPPADSLSTSRLHPIEVLVETVQYGTKSIMVNLQDTVGDIKLRLCPLLGLTVEDVDDFKLKSQGGIVHPSSLRVSDLPSTDLAMDDVDIL